MSAKLVPKLLNFLQKQYRVDVTKEMLNRINIRQAIIIGDETWIYEFDILTK